MGASIYSVGNLNGQVGYAVKDIFLDTAFTFKGNVSWYSDLESITANNGDVYHVENGSNYVYFDGQWWDVGSSVTEDLTPEQIAELQGLVHQGD